VEESDPFGNKCKQTWPFTPFKIRVKLLDLDPGKIYWAEVGLKLEINIPMGDPKPITQRRDNFRPNAPPTKDSVSETHLCNSSLNHFDCC